MKLSKKFKRQKRNILLKCLATLAIVTSGLAIYKTSGGSVISDKTADSKLKTDLETEYQVQESDSTQATTALLSNSEPLTEALENSMIATGNNFVAVLKTDGSVWTWGNNNYGQLGNGEIKNASTYQPTRVLGVNGEGYLNNIKQISAGSYGVIALTNDGKVVAWGANNYGQLANTTTSNSGVPVYVQKQVEVTDEENNSTSEYRDLDNIKQVSCGTLHNLALANDGTVWSWGLNNYGQLGISVGSTSSSNENYKRTYAVKVQQKENESTTLVDLDNIKQVSGGIDFSTALTNDGTIYAWGLGTSGQIGNGVAETVYVPTQVSNLVDITKIDAGGMQTIALKKDGTVWGWGLNRYGNLGINTSSTTTSNAAYKKTTPVQVLVAASTPIENVVDISSMNETSFALTKDGEVYGWGLNTSGQIADNTIVNKTVATKVKVAGGAGITKIKCLADGQQSNTNFMIDENGYVYGNGVSSSYQLMSNRVTNTYFAKNIDKTYLKLSNNNAYLEVGNTADLTASYYNGFNVANYEQKLGNVTYKSSDEDIATVDNFGKVTAKSRGYATIIAEDTTNGYRAQSIINVISKRATALPMVVSGTTFTAYLKEDGTVWTSGAGANGVLGNGSSVNTNIPNQVKISTNEYLTDIRKISVGTEHVIALRKDGTVWAWGLNSSGQLGDGTTTNSLYAIKVKDTEENKYLENVIDIATGLDFSLALLSDGTAYGWGDAASYALGTNSTSDPKLPIKIHDGDNIIQMQGGTDTTVVLKGDGTVWATGLGTSGQIGDDTNTTRAELVPVINDTKDNILSGIVKIVSGSHHTIALKEDKTAVIWGYNTNGQLGINSTTTTKSPTSLKNVGNTDIMQNISNIGTGPNSTYIEDKDGNVYATGLNTTGQLSLGTKTSVKIFTAVKDEDGNNLTNVATLGVSRGTTYGFVFDDGTVGVTGLGTSGQHGNSTYVDSSRITKIQDANIYTDDLYEIAVSESAKINVQLKQGFNLNIDNSADITLGTLKYTSLDEDVVQVSEDGTIKGIAEGTTGVKVQDETNGLETVVQVIVGKRDFSNIYKIVAGNSHTVLLKNDGTVWSWGDNTYGQLGNGQISGEQTENPVQVLGVNGQGYLTDVVDVAAGTSFTVALRKNGEVVAWGRNDYGQLGNTNDVTENPIYVKDKNGNKLTGVTDISAARDHAAAVKADGTVWTWGRNDYGQLGNNTTITSNYAVQVLDSKGTGYLNNIKDVSVGSAYVTALAKDGTVWSWGYGTSGQMGNGAKTTQKLPVQAKNVTDVQKIIAGYYTTTALKTDGTVWAWGYNGYGQLANGTTTSSATAVQVKLNSTTYLTNVKDIGGIANTKYALTEDGIVYGWGLNSTNEIGDYTSTNKTYATKVVRIYNSELENNVEKLINDSAYSFTNYMIKKDGTILANGKVSDGQLLDGGKYTGGRNYADDVRSSYLEFSNRIDYIKVGESKKLEVNMAENLNVFAKAPTIGKLTWKSTNEDVATIDQNGNIKAKKLGNTTIIVEEDNNGYRAQATIYITNNKENTITSPMVVQGTNFTAALKADGTVWATGLNTYGVLGDGTKNHKAELEQVKIDENTNLTDVVRIAAGASHMIAVTKNGEVYSVGLGTSGQLGVKSSENSSYAKKVLNENGKGYLSNIIDVSAGSAHSVALDKDGNVYTWGRGANYQLGNYETANKTLPVKVVDAYNVIKVSAGSEFTTLLRGDGVGQGTGLNTNGWLATGDTNSRYTPIEMGNATSQSIYKNIIDIVAGGKHVLVLKEDGKVYTVGLNTSGQLAQATTTSSSSIVSGKMSNIDEQLVDLEDVAYISAGNETSFAVTKDGKAYSCGLNTSRQLGTGDTTSPIKVFTQVKDNEEKFKDIVFSSVGSSNTVNSAYILRNGTLWTVGKGSSGELGNKEYLDSNNVVRVGNEKIEAKEQHVKLQVDKEKQIELDMIQGYNIYGDTKDMSTNLKYESLNQDIATVSTSGLITAKKIGKTKIKITDLENNLVEYVEVVVLDSLGFTESKVSSGLNFTIALKEDGTVWSWGNGASGRLGTGNTNNQTEAVQVMAPDGKKKLTGVIDIAVGYDNASALLSDGTVVSWGNNGNYSLGNGTNIDSTVPVFVIDENGNKLQNIVKISRGDDSALALTKDGEIYSWGYNKYGELGVGSTTNVQYPTKVKDQTGKGTLFNVIDINTTMYASFATLEDGTVWSWGHNANGELANGTTDSRTLPKETKLTNIAQISTSAYSGMALKEDGTLWSWGWNGYGQLADGTTEDKSIPVQAKFDANTVVSGIIDIGTAGATHYILDNDHRVYAAGLNTQGQIGDNTTTNKSYFVEVKAKYGEVLSNQFVKLSKSMARTNSSTDTSTAYFTREDGSLFGVGKNTSYQLFGGMTVALNSAKEMNISYMQITERTNYIKIGETKKLITDVVENFNMYAKVPETGNITWSSSNEQVAKVDKNGVVTAKTEGQTTITAVDSKYGYIASSVVYVTRNIENAITVPQVAQGLNYTVVLKADGTVWATGANEVGQCGIGTTEANIDELKQVKLSDGTSLTNVVKIASGLSHNLALTKDGKVYVWGSNAYGQLGINSTVNSKYAVLMLNEIGTEEIQNIVDIAAGRSYSVIVKSNGDTYAVGHNVYGQLGNGAKTNTSILSKVKEVQNVIQVAAGQYHTTMLRADGTVWSVGRNYNGELGLNSNSSSSTGSDQGVSYARQVKNSENNGVLKNISQIAVGGYHNVALTNSKQVYTWGYGKDGQLGLNSTVSYALPQILLDNTDGTNGVGNIAKIGTSERSTFVVTDNNEVLATGENSNYQLAQNNNTDLLKITNLYNQDGENYINNIINVISSSSNTNNTAVIKADGTVWVSGLNAYGQVGNSKYETTTVYTRMGNARLETEDKIITISEGNSQKLNVSIKDGFNVYEDEKEVEGNLKYTSSSSSVVKVNEQGMITAICQGSARITIHDETNLWTTTVLVNVTRDAEDKVKAKVETGEASAILKTDGTVWTSGDNTYGERGVGDTNVHKNEVQVLDTNGVDKLTDVIDVSAGQYFIAAVKQDGRVITWGQGNVGQLGNGQNVNKSVPVYVIDKNGNELTNIIKVSCGQSYAMALTKDGQVYTWGSNGKGQLGNNTSANSNVAVKVKDVTGKGYLLDICDITAQYNTSVALTNTGDVYSWGDNSCGQMGNGTSSSAGRTTPAKASISDVSKIVGGHHCTLALKNDGTLWSWGGNTYGQLGNATESTYKTPSRVIYSTKEGMTDVVDIGTSYLTSFAILSDGTIYGWGRNNYGQLGNNTKVNSSVPVKLKKQYGEEFTDRIVGLNKNSTVSTNFLIREDGTILGNGYTSSTLRLMTDRTTDIPYVKEIRPDFIQIDNRSNYVKQGEQITLKTELVQNLNAFAGHIKLGKLNWSSSDTSVATVTNEGVVTSVGLGEATITVKDIENGYQAQAIVYTIQNNEKAITMPDIAQGVDFTAVLKADGTVWTTGLNTSGQLGDGTTVNKSRPVQVKINSKEYLSNIVKISAGTDHVIAVSKTGEVYTWGENDYGQLGNGATTRSVYATKVLNSNGDSTIKDVIDVNAGHKFSIVLLKDGTVYGFGRNAYGELGILNNTNKSLPTQMDGIVNAVKIQANSNGSTIQIGNGTVWTTGYNTYGTLGQNMKSSNSGVSSIRGLNAANPVVNATSNGVLKNVVKIASGINHTIALTEDKQALAWGGNNVGQLGTTDTTSYAYPVSMKVLETGEKLTDKVLDIGTSGNRTLVKTIDSNNTKHVLITGENTYGQLGNNTTANTTSLIPVKNSENTEEAKGLDILPTDSRSTDNTGYIDEEGSVWTVGLNTYGQIGDDTIYQRKNIVQVGEISLKAEDIIFTMNINDTKQINTHMEDSFNVYIKDVEATTLKYESLDKNIAEVSQTGVVTAKSVGNTLIKITDTERNIETAVYVKVIKNENDMKYQPMVDGGEKYSVALKGDGTVWTWGYNNYGQLGNNSTVTTEIPTQVKGYNAEGFLNDIQMIASGKNHVLALKEDGTVWAWGYNNYGQLGDNTQITRYTPVQVLSEDGTEYLKDIIYIAAGNNYSVAINKNGEVWSWGQNDYGQLGDGSNISKYTPVRAKANLTNIIKVSCGNRHTVALKADGSVYTWGDNTYGQLSDNTKGKKLIPVKVLETSNTYVSDAISISATDNSTNILKGDGTVIAVGLGTSGQLGDNTNVNKTLPVQVVNTDNTGALSQIIEIKSGANTTYALSEEGKVYSWGLGTSGQLGNNEVSNSYIPVVVTNNTVDSDLDNILYIGAGSNHALAVENNGYIDAWGLNDKKQIGDATLAISTIPRYIGSKVKATPKDVTLKVDETQDVKVTMESFNLFKAEDELARDITFKSLNENVATVSNKGTITAKTIGITKIIVTDNLFGKTTVVNVSVLQEGAIATPKVASGLNHTVALKSDGTVWTYGANKNGELGVGTNVASDNLSKVEFETDVKIVEIAVGEKHVVALDENGTVWTWGSNTYYQLGISSKAQSNVPVKVKLEEKVVKIAAGYNSTFAITEDNNLLAWGLNTNGELGIGNYQNRFLPTKVETLKNVLDVKAGKTHSVVITTNGQVYTTGNNSYGSLTGTEYKRNTFEKVEGLDNIAYLSSGEYHNMAMTTNRKLYVWGYNVYGQLGTNTIDTTNTPVQITNVSGIKEISAGRSHSMLLTKSGKVYATGLNSLGQFGNNSTENQVEFTLVDTINNVNTLVAGNTYSMAIKEDGSVWAWGDYYHGVTDIKTISNSVVPVQIGKQSFYLKENDISVNKEGTKQLEVNSEFQFNVFEDNICNNNYKYTSLNTDIATVDDNGIITGVSVGTTWVKVVETTTNEEQIAIVRVIEKDNKVAPKVTGGENYAVVLKANGSIWSFGYNSNGELGNSTFASTKEPKEINILKSYTNVTAGDNFTLILRNDGTVWSVGDNQYGQLALGNRTSCQTPTLVESLSNVTKISAGKKHAIALTKYGEVYTWGANENGQLGINNTSTQDIPNLVTIPGATIVDVAAGNGYTALVDNKGKVYVCGKVAGINSTEPVAIETITTAVKVAAGDELIVLTKDGNVVKIGDVNTEIYNSKDAIDIVAKDSNYMLLTKSNKMYTWGTNKNGQLGLENSTDVTTPTLVDTDTNVISIGSGINNTYYIANSGLVYASGLNTYGQLGNGTNQNSNTYKLVGTREFSVKPDNILMSVNDELDLEVESERYNVLKEDLRTVNDFDWVINDESIATIEDVAKVKAIAEGETKLKATQKDTGAEQEVTVIVEAIDAQRIDQISVNNVDAKVSGSMKYEVTITTDEDKGNLIVTTKDSTDKISIDGGVTWFEEGSLNAEVELPNPSTEIPIKIETANGTQFDYILTVIKQSNIADLEHVYVNDIEATAISSTEYSIVLEDKDLTTAKVKAITTSTTAMVGIDNEEEILHEAEKDISVENTLIRTVPIKVIAESGKEVNYVLTIYKKSAITELESLTVDGVETTKNNFLNYSIIVEKDTKEVDVKATALYELANVNINNMGEEVKETTRKITLTGDETIVKIKVIAEGEEKEYTLTIIRKQDGSSLGNIYVNGEEATKVDETTYEAYIATNATNAEVLTIASVKTSIVQIGVNASEVGQSKVTVDTTDTINTYTITITDSEDVSNTATYKLIIKKPSTDNTLKQITVSNSEMSVIAERITGTNTYKAKVNEKYTDMTVTAIANYELSEVAINENSYQAKQDKLDITFNEKNYTLPIKVKSQDGTEETYTLILERLSSNTQLSYVKVNDVEATLSTTLEDTYEITLTSKEKDVTVNAKTANEFAEIALNNVVYETSEITKTISMDSKDITVKINVKAEDGTLKTYDLIIHSLPDVTTVKEISVNGIVATQVPYTNKYEVRVPNALETYNVTTIAEDSLAYVKIATFEAEQGTSTRKVAKEASAETTTVNINITAQDADVKEDYILEILPMSTDVDLSYVKVDGNIIEKSEDGEYHVKVENSKENVTIEALTDDEKATVGIDEKGISNKVSKTGELTADTTVFDIIVTAEDGIQITYKLNVEKMSNNTDLLDLYVDDNLITNVDGKYIAKIGNAEQATVKAITADENALVSVDGNEDILHENTETVDVKEEEKTIEITVTAEDGTKTTHYLILQRYSNDNTLLSISADGVSDENITQTSETTYQMVVSNEVSTLDLTAITSKDVAKVKINNNEYEINKTTQNISIPNDTNTVSITVQAENGSEKEYTLTIIKKYLLTVDSIVVNNENATKEDDEYIAWIDTDATEAEVVITPTSNKANVKVGDIANGTGTTKFTVNTPDEETTLKIIVSSPVEEDQVEYTLRIIKKSANTELEYVKVNNNDGILNEDGTYTIKVPVQAEEYDMNVKTISAYANVRIEDNEYSVQTDSYKLDLTNTTSKQVTVMVKAQNGTEKEYTVNVQKISDDNSIKQLTVNGSEIKEEDGTYKAFIKANLTSVPLYIETTHEGATIELDKDEEYIHTVTKNVETDDSEEVINIKVTAEDGSIKTYILYIIKESDDAGMQKVTVDSKDAILTEDGTYYITAASGATEVEIRVVAANQYASVQINGSEKAIGENTIKYTLPKDTKIANVPIVITAQNGTDIETYTLKIEQVSNNTNLEKVQVNENDVTIYDEVTKTYTYVIDYSVDEATVYVETEDENATVKIDTGSLSKHSATETVSTASDENIYTITVIAEDGTKETRDINIKKLSKDASIIKLYVNNLEVEQDEDGTYTTNVLESIKEAAVRVKTTNKNAQIEINKNLLEDKGEATEMIDTTISKKIVVPIKIIAEDTSVVNETTLTINMVSDNKDLEYVKVNNVEVTEYDETSHTYKAFIPSNSTSATIDIKTVSANAKISIDSTQYTSTTSYTLTTEEDITYLYVDVIAEDGSVRTYTIVLQKISTDSTIKELFKDGVLVDEQDDGNYIINVSEDTSKVTLKATTNNEYANIAIGTEDANLKETEKEITLDEGKVTKTTITVTAQDGTSSVYSVTINKLSSNNELEYVKVNSETLTNYDKETKTYETFISEDATSALIDIKAKSEYATIESGDTTGTQTISFTASTDAEETVIDVNVTAENGILETYYIRLIKISKDNTIKEIYVDNALVEKDSDGKYIANVLESKTDAVVKVIANNKYADVQIGIFEAEKSQSEQTVALSKEKLTNVEITITSQSGEILHETLTIKKVSDDAGINTVLINGIETKDYDKDTKTYTAYVDADSEEAEVSVMANSNYATVIVDITSGIGNATETVETENEITKVSVSVKAETGKVEKYTVKIIKKSADSTLEILKVNDVEIEEPYEVEIKKLDTKAKIYVKATNNKATVKIADEEAELGESTAILDIPLGQDTITIPVIVTAQNGVNRQSYNITLRRLSNDAEIREIVVNDEVVDLNTLEHIVKNVNESNIKVTTQNEKAKVAIDTATATVNVATAKVNTKSTTVRTITVTAEDGTAKEYTLTLIKKVTIEGKITDQNIMGEHIATVTTYQTDDKRVEGDSTDPREVISAVQTNSDGSYEILLEPGVYDVVFTKAGYLSHRITGIDIKDGLGATLDTVNMLGGDVVETGEIEIDDLVSMNDNYGPVTEEKDRFDLNGDGVINSLDRNILKKNYGKKAQIVEWIDPNAVATTSANRASRAITTKQDFILPMTCKYTITSEYGTRKHPTTGIVKKHTGIDLAGTWHTEILSVADGEITFAGVQNGFGNCVEIKHIVNGEAIYSFYAHLSKINVKAGETVKQGQVIGLEGGDPKSDPNPGNSTGHHLHFEIRNASGYQNDVDPTKYIKF